MIPRLCLIKTIKIENYRREGHIKQLDTVWREGVIKHYYEQGLILKLPRHYQSLMLCISVSICLISTLADFCSYITDSDLPSVFNVDKRLAFLLFYGDKLVCQQSHSEHVSIFHEHCKHQSPSSNIATLSGWSCSSLVFSDYLHKIMIQLEKGWLEKSYF